MSEIQVIIPLAVLAGAKDLTPEGIVNFLQETADKSIIIDGANTRIELLQNVIRGAGTTLEIIWEEIDNFKRAQEIRNLIKYLKTFEAKGVKE